MLLRNRKALYNPKTHAMMGFLYARFQKGSEFWEIHEVLRKCALMGLLIFLPATSRAAVGILICVVCCCTLNYFQPHRNRVVLFVSQMSFLMSTFKYVCAVFLRINDLDKANAMFMGWIMVMFDVVFMMASAVAFVLMVVLLRASADKLQDKDTVREEGEGGGGGSDEEGNPPSLVKVVPSKLGTVLRKALVENDVTNVINTASSSAQKHREKITKKKQRAGDRLKKRLKQRAGGGRGSATTAERQGNDSAL